MKRFLLLLLSVALVATLGAGTGTQYSGLTTVTYRQGVNGYSGWKDAFITDADTSANYGACDTLFVQKSTNEYRILFGYSLVGIPDSAMIVSTKVHWYQNWTTGTASVPRLTIYRLFNAWTEGDSNGGANATYCDWNDAGPLAWKGAGASLKVRSSTSFGDWMSQTWSSYYTTNADTAWSSTRRIGTDCDTLSTAYDTPWLCAGVAYPKVTTGTGRIRKTRGWTSWELQHEAWVYHKGANDGFGFLVVADEDGYLTTDGVSYRSSEYPDPNYRPYVEITYYDPDTVTVVHDTTYVGTPATVHLGMGTDPIGRQ